MNAMTHQGRPRAALARACGALVALALIVGPARAADDDPFDVKYKTGATNGQTVGPARAAIVDPFDIKFKAPPRTGRTVGPAEKSAGTPVARYKPGPPEEKPPFLLANKIEFTATVSPATARPGDIVKLTVTGTPLNGYHTYPLTKLAVDQPEQTKSKLVVATDSVFRPLWPVLETEPVPVNENGVIWLEHSQKFTWIQAIYIDPKAPAGPHSLKILIFAELCKATCTPPGTPYPPIEVTVNVEGEPIKPSAELQKRLAEKPPQITREPVSSSKIIDDRPKEASSLWALLGFAFIGAILMQLTPCVFPMIPITVNFFLKQSEKEHHKALPTALVYAGTIIVLLTLVLVAIGHQVIAWAVNPWFNLGLGVVMVIFALSLFGMYEIELPQSLARFTSAHEGQGGFAGAVFMALTFTITSFTCTGPFLGAMLGGAAALRPPFLHFVLAALVYSATFAAPFFLLALFPAMLKKLPKSGGWLNAIKVTMGFIELALALKFLGNADITWNAGNAVLFNYDTVLSAWIALSAACGLYLMGIFRLPHDDKVESIGVVRMLFAFLFIGMAIYLTPALRRETPLGVVGENLIAFLPPPPPDRAAAGDGKTAANGKLAWHLDYEKAWQEAVKGKEPKLIFIDFTGVTCSNCRKNEDTVFPKPEVRAELAKYVRVQLYTDAVPNRELEDRGDAKLNDKRRDAIGDNTNPYYVIFQPDRDAPFDKDGLLKGKVLGSASGVIFDIPQFVKLLQRGLQEAPIQVASAG
jgi:thiol:disulfide interchange protein DsbD